MGIDLTDNSDNWLQEEVDEDLEYNSGNPKEQLEPILSQLLSQKEVESELRYTKLSTQILEKADEELKEWYKEELPDPDQMEDPLEAVEEANRAVAERIIDTYIEDY